MMGWSVAERYITSKRGMKKGVKDSEGGSVRAEKSFFLQRQSRRVVSVLNSTQGRELMLSSIDRHKIHYSAGTLWTPQVTLTAAYNSYVGALGLHERLLLTSHSFTVNPIMGHFSAACAFHMLHYRS